MANLRLFYSIELGDVKMVKSLLKTGSDVNCKDAFGRRPIHLCAIEGEVEIARLLLFKGAKKNQKNKYGCTPLHLACMNSRVEMVRFLVVEGVDLEARDKCGNTPCHLACEYGSMLSLKVLLAKGINVDAVNQFGETPLHVASKRGHLELVGALLQCGANAAATDSLQKTPLHFCVEGLHSQCVAILIKHGCPKDAVDKYGRTAFTIAQSRQQSEPPPNLASKFGIQSPKSSPKHKSKSKGVRNHKSVTLPSLSKPKNHKASASLMDLKLMKRFNREQAAVRQIMHVLTSPDEEELDQDVIAVQPLTSVEEPATNDNEDDKQPAASVASVESTKSGGE